MTTYTSILPLNLGAVPFVDNPDLYEELLDIHNAIEVMAAFVGRSASFTVPIIGNHTIRDTEGTIRVDASTVSSVVTMPIRIPTNTGYKYVIKRIDTNAANTVTLAGAGSDLIDGVATKLIAPLGSLTVQTNDTGIDII